MLYINQHRTPDARAFLFVMRAPRSFLLAALWRLARAGGGGGGLGVCGAARLEGYLGSSPGGRFLSLSLFLSLGLSLSLSLSFSFFLSFSLSLSLSLFLSVFVFKLNE